jgi:large subunit ribosomal protein L23
MAAKKKVETVEKVETEEVNAYLTRPVILKDYEVLKYIIVTERTQRLQDSDNAMVFAVNKRASKLEIKCAVEAVFQAKVKSVNTIQCTGKKRRVGRYEGKLADLRKPSSDSIHPSI